ncbi:MAG: ABC transporter substrate-binding protein [Treponema sp.]|uniref:ABC transporter substrate-binding protein n=1 Tax=Treponema sp. TaxID=166 RepID=UPI001D5D0BAC|nr:ABC transporter substrate-binding protein [Treponema sp.]MBS7310142.1 ABC transporter substrate-binding protein [Treponema sp.]MCI5697101.1 ABC transporter substrate-binding protein [Spirochaetia bacterium]MDD5810545.1 ABC transporter substrate-binding protein [Treponema sp.]
MKKSIIAMMMAAAVAFCFTSCGSEKKSKVVKIGVIQLVEHPALDANYQGFVDGLKEAGYVDGQNIKIDYQNAQGEQANCVTIAQKLINDRSDLIFAIATPAAQAVANLTDEIPIVISSVTDPESAKLVQKNTAPGNNVTGTSDLTPCAAQMQLLKKICPEAKTVGMLFCSSEQNSYFQIALAEKACDELGLKYVEATVSNSNEIQQVVQNLSKKVDVIYSPTDNMIAAGMTLVAQVATENGIPTIVGEEGMVNAGGLATYGLSYYELGKQTAKMAVEVIEGKKPADMPIQYLDKCDLKINEDTAKKLGITIPSNL